MGAMTPEQERLYAGVIATVTKAVERIAREGLAPEAVAEVVGEAIESPRPRARYVIGREARIQAVAARLLPDRVFDALVRRSLT